MRRNRIKIRRNRENIRWLVKQFKQSRKEKPRLIGAEKTILSETKDELVVRIPPVLGISPIVIQPQAIIIPIQVEHVQVAISVSYMYIVPSVALPA